MALEMIKKSKAYDIWDDTEDKVNVEQRRRQAKRLRSKLPHFEAPVALPHPGQSYNPRPEDHAALLRKVAEQELKLKRHEAALTKEFSGTKVSDGELAEHERLEMLSGLEHSQSVLAQSTHVSAKDGKHSTSATQHNENKSRHEDDEDDDEDSETSDSDYDMADYDAILKDKTVVERRKTGAQRLRQMRDRLQRKQAKLRKARNIRLSQFNAIKSISRQVEKETWLREQLQAHHQRRHRRRLHKLSQKFDRSDPVYCLPSQLPSSLRQVQCPLDAMVRERLESWQARQLVEPSSRQSRRLRYERKHFQRRCAEEK